MYTGQGRPTFLPQTTRRKIITVFGVAALVSVCAALYATPQRFNMKAPSLPDPQITPGDVLPVTSRDVCVSGYAGKVRAVPESVKKQAYENYGITQRAKGEYEVDHLISLELGGSNSIRNLWPESYQTKPWNAHVKDQLENELHRAVCSGEMDLAAAQKEIAGDWIAAYKARFHTDRPLAKVSGNRKVKVAKAPHAAKPIRPIVIGRKYSVKKSQVWVNLGTGIYWRPGTRYYGKTTEGHYMTEAEAKRAGYRAAKGR